MIRNILVPTDFSNNALKAAMYAAVIAQKSGATLNLLHVVAPVADSIRQPFRLHERYEHEIEADRKRQLDVERLALQKSYPGVNIISQIAQGSVSHCIKQVAHDNHVELVVMGTQGASGLKEMFAGSNTSAVIAETDLPILAIPKDYEASEPHRILFATNRFEEDEQLVKNITQFAALFSAQIHVAVFINNATAEAADYLINERQLHHYIEWLHKYYPQVHCDEVILEGHDFEETIARYDEKHDIDMIAMITYPKDFWTGLFKKGHTKKMAFHTNIPLLAIPAKQ